MHHRDAEDTEITPGCPQECRAFVANPDPRRTRKNGPVADRLKSVNVPISLGDIVIVSPMPFVILLMAT